MSIYSLYQIPMVREAYDYVNQVGWAKAFEKYPIVEARQNLQCKGSEAMETRFAEYFVKVCDIKCDSPEEAFRIHNFQEEDSMIRYAPQHTMSVGDVLVGPEGDVLMCDSFGWQKLEGQTIGGSEAAMA
tara:strand:- start:50 stop:436 length:387 start_codon:yes stop_codon:yes gene_type:complete